MNSVSGFEDDRARKSALKEMVEGINKRYNNVRHITPAEVVALQKERDRVVLVDVRMKDEYEISHLPGAVSLEQFESCRADSTPEGTGVVVAYCTVGVRSSEYAQKLTEAGYDAFNLSGSILAWCHDGLPLVTGDAGAEQLPTKRVHVFGDRWRLQPSTYEAITFKTPFISLALNKASTSLSKLFGR